MSAVSLHLTSKCAIFSQIFTSAKRVQFLHFDKGSERCIAFLLYFLPPQRAPASTCVICMVILPSSPKSTNLYSCCLYDSTLFFTKEYQPLLVLSVCPSRSVSHKTDNQQVSPRPVLLQNLSIIIGHFYNIVTKMAKIEFSHLIKF